MRSGGQDSISHRGRVVEISPAMTSVEIISESACASCHAKGLCGLGESKSKLVQLPTSPYLQVDVGDEVDVLLSATMGHKAVWIAYVIPFAVLMSCILYASDAADDLSRVVRGSGSICSKERIIRTSAAFLSLPVI